VVSACLSSLDRLVVSYREDCSTAATASSGQGRSNSGSRRCNADSDQRYRTGAYAFLSTRAR